MKRISLLVIGIMTLALFLNCNPTNSNNNGTHNTVVFTDSVTDVDGNVYHAITIGTQSWTVENLKTTKYNDGAQIPLVTDNTEWGNLTTGAYCWYNNGSDTNTYGALYNWYVVSTGKLAPAGWHVPTDEEWYTLENYLIAHGYNYDGTTSGNKLAKSMSAKTNWAITDSIFIGAIGNNVSTNNQSGFSAFPGGCRIDSTGVFDYLAEGTGWWSTTVFNVSDANCRTLFNTKAEVMSGIIGKRIGLSVRLVKDN